MFIHIASPYALTEYKHEILDDDQTSFESRSFPGILEWIIAEAIIESKDIFTQDPEHEDYKLAEAFRALVLRMVLHVIPTAPRSPIPKINYNNISLSPVISELYNLEPKHINERSLSTALVPLWRIFFGNRKVIEAVPSTVFEIPEVDLNQLSSDTPSIDDMEGVLEFAVCEVIGVATENLMYMLLNSKSSYEINDLCSKAETFRREEHVFPRVLIESIAFYRGPGNFRVDPTFIKVIFDDNLSDNPGTTNGYLYWAVQMFHKSGKEGVLKACG